MRSIICAVSLALVTGCGSDVAIVGHTKNSKGEKCWPISHELAPGSIRCWSGGELVYGNYIYHNGGVLCSTDGKEIKITGGKSLCVIESNQDSSWEPPNEQLTPVP